MFDSIQYRLLRRFYPGGSDRLNGSAYDGKSKLETLFGPEIWRAFCGKIVIDYGCGEGTEALEIARHGAALVIGLDCQERLLAMARSRANATPNLVFTMHVDQQADVIISLDAFEHFDRPNDVLRDMTALLKPDGRVFVSFGWPWYHPLGGHLVSVFPWAHLLFSERALMRWRQDFKSDGATKFEECEGGLNRMTIRRFEELVALSPLRFERMVCVPIRRTRVFHNRFTREYLTATIRCCLVKR